MIVDHVTCAICGAVRKKITVQHVKMHGMTIAEYKEEFPNSEMVSSATREKLKTVANDRWKNGEEREKARKIAKRQWSDPKARESMSKLKNELYEKCPEIKDKIRKSLTGLKQTTETKEKRRKTMLKRYEDPEERIKTGNKSRGHSVSKEVRLKIGAANSGEGNGNFGKHPSKETLEKLRLCRMGEKNHAWKGGISFGEYCPKFNGRLKQEIRDRYDNCDFISGLPAHICNPHRNLDVHHIDYNKMQGCDEHEWRLIPLSMSNHRKTNFNRVFWNSLFTYALQYDEMSHTDENNIMEMLI